MKQTLSDDEDIGSVEKVKREAYFVVLLNEDNYRE
jgi:hypothetical protein